MVFNAESPADPLECPEIRHDWSREEVLALLPVAIQ